MAAQGLPEPSSLRGRTLGTRAAEHKACKWGMQLVDWRFLQLAVYNHTFSGVHMQVCATEMNSIQHAWPSRDGIRYKESILHITLHYKLHIIHKVLEL